MGFICQLDEKNRRVAEHGDLAQGFQFSGPAIARRAELGHPIHDICHLIAQLTWEALPDLVQGAAAVLHGIMQQRSNRPCFITDQPVNQPGNPDAMRFKVRLAAEALLSGVQLLTPAIGFCDGFGARCERQGFKLHHHRADIADEMSGNHALLPGTNSGSSYYRGFSGILEPLNCRKTTVKITRIYSKF